MINQSKMKAWEFNVFNIYNYNLEGPYRFIFDFLSKNQADLNCDLLEAGVYRGRMTLSMAHFLKQYSLPGKIHGFDTFTGFPSYSVKDNIQNFRELLILGKITTQHFEQVEKLQHYNLNVLNRGIAPDSISTSGGFEDSRLDELVKKMDFFGLDNIILHPGDFAETMKSPELAGLKFSLIFIDCDLYDGYQETLRYGWDRLVSGGIIFLDEYYSLKFPGARLAVDEFLSDKSGFRLLEISESWDDFERWVILKDE